MKLPVIKRKPERVNQSGKIKDLLLIEGIGQFPRQKLDIPGTKLYRRRVYEAARKNHRNELGMQLPALIFKRYA